MIEKIKALEEVSRFLDPSASQRDVWNKEVLHYADQVLMDLNESKAYHDPEGHEGNWEGLDITEERTALTALLEGMTANIHTVGINAASGGHLGYVPGGGLYPSALGDYLAAVSNAYAGVFFASPGAIRLENMLIRWMCRLMGFPDTSIGNLTSGGSIANLVAIVTAREAHGIRSRDVERCVIYLSEQAHHSIKKALRIAGLSEAQARYIPLDEGLRLSPEVLERCIEEDRSGGLKPFFINTSFGTTNTGAVDPMQAIAGIAQKHGLWFHVDAAYGGFFKLVPEIGHKYEGMEQADSITMDPHKTLFLPFGTGAVLIREKQKVVNAHRYLADYLQDIVDHDEEISPADVSPELTKHFRGMRMWMPLKLFGLRPFRAALEEKLHLARYFHKEIARLDGFERGPEPELSIALFRYVGSEGDANEFNKALISSIQKDGRIFLSSTTIDDVFWIRVAIVLFRTHLAEIDLLLKIIQEKVTAIAEARAQ